MMWEKLILHTHAFTYMGLQSHIGAATLQTSKCCLELKILSMNCHFPQEMLCVVLHLLFIGFNLKRLNRKCVYYNIRIHWLMYVTCCFVIFGSGISDVDLIDPIRQCILTLFALKYRPFQRIKSMCVVLCRSLQSSTLNECHFPY